jgi:phosphatidylethanolamine/phosphatidyl-N-methylethanolamine N-methyltransferase
VKPISARARFLFLRSLLVNPKCVGAVVPSSPRLSRFIASRIDPGSTPVLEIGAGTGAITRALLEGAVDPKSLFVIERDPELAAPVDRIDNVNAMLNTLSHNGQLIQYTYSAECPIPTRRFGLEAECLGRVWQNLPPASVWRFVKKH